MAITTKQIADCAGGAPATYTAFIRSGELKATKIKNKTGQKKYEIQKEDLADFFIRHPTYWRRFLSLPQQKRYLRFREIILREVRRKAGRSGPLYYKLNDLSKLFDVPPYQFQRMARDKLFEVTMDGRAYFLSEENVIAFIKGNPMYLNALEQFHSSNRWENYLRDRLLRLYKEEEDSK